MLGLSSEEVSSLKTLVIATNIVHMKKKGAENGCDESGCSYQDILNARKNIEKIHQSFQKIKAEDYRAYQDFIKREFGSNLKLNIDGITLE